MAIQDSNYLPKSQLPDTFCSLRSICPRCLTATHSTPTLSVIRIASRCLPEHDHPDRYRQPQTQRLSRSLLASRLPRDLPEASLVMCSQDGQGRGAGSGPLRMCTILYSECSLIC